MLCLQDVDFFHQWWSPQLTTAGYDSLFKQRTNRSAFHREGVVIAWKRDMFDLFRSGEMELNRWVLWYLEVDSCSGISRKSSTHRLRI